MDWFQLHIDPIFLSETQKVNIVSCPSAGSSPPSWRCTRCTRPPPASPPPPVRWPRAHRHSPPPRPIPCGTRRNLAEQWNPPKRHKNHPKSRKIQVANLISIYIIIHIIYNYTYYVYIYICILYQNIVLKYAKIHPGTDEHRDADRTGAIRWCLGENSGQNGSFGACLAVFM